MTAQRIISKPAISSTSSAKLESHNQKSFKQEAGHSMQRVATEALSANATFYYTPETSQIDLSDTKVTTGSKRIQRPPSHQQQERDAKRKEEELVPLKGSEPDWEKHPHCFAYLQGCFKKYSSQYLQKKKSSTDNRAGYIIGRTLECDIVVDTRAVSREHCLIYMETGSNGVAKGIRIYLENLSNFGTWVNKKLIGPGKRILLRGGDTIALYLQHGEHLTFFTVRFPPVFAANTCEYEYNFNSELGKGNFATVYHAFIRDTQTPVAIKVMSKAPFESKPKLLESIIQEMSIMMHIEKHPLVIQMKEIFNEKSRIFLVIEYVRDGELFNCIRDKRMFTEDESRFVFWQLFNAIKYLHRLGIAHRDLKPENVLLADRQKLIIKVSDFGLAKKQERNQFFGSQCGTPNYVAPEVLNPSEVRAYTLQCDMWSLGVMLYVCLCGFAPFSDENGPPSMKAQIKMGKFDFPSPYWDNISPEAKDLITALLTVNPDERATVNKALEMPWMTMNLKDLEERKQDLGESVLATIERLGNRPEIEPTQPNQLQSMSLVTTEE